jgi:hypothetical protein
MDATKDMIAAAKLFILPSLTGLTEDQVRGFACVWNGEPLTDDTAVALGKRTAKRAGAPVDWHPRACRDCVQLAAYTNLHTHAGVCEQCVDNAAECDTGAALLRLMKECRS